MFCKWFLHCTVRYSFFERLVNSWRNSNCFTTGFVCRVQNLCSNPFFVNLFCVCWHFKNVSSPQHCSDPCFRLWMSSLLSYIPSSPDITWTITSRHFFVFLIRILDVTVIPLFHLFLTHVGPGAAEICTWTCHPTPPERLQRSKEWEHEQDAHTKDTHTNLVSGTQNTWMSYTTQHRGICVGATLSGNWWEPKIKKTGKLFLVFIINRKRES